MKAITNGDLIAATAVGDVEGIDIPAGLLGLPADRRRFVSGELVDAAALASFYIDPQGRKHAVAGDPGWPLLACAWDAVLVKAGDAWSVQTETERVAIIKAQLGVEIDAEAERRRRLYITPGSGQAMVYQRKAEEAHTFKTWRDTNPSGTPDHSAYPILAASIGIEGATLDDVAQLVIQTETTWLAAAAAIESVRLSGKASVNAAITEETARAARAAVTWPQA
jgi:hypothetical protein